ncbi:hypothetical protein [Paenibacillus vulneris]|uniref:Uncharacterized protein n=1 Tax=Paenibacillus vulneris TaxID=1133364 RepID=A0ABW3UUF2_9BACL
MNQGEFKLQNAKDSHIGFLFDYPLIAFSHVLILSGNQPDLLQLFKVGWIDR